MDRTPNYDAIKTRLRDDLGNNSRKAIQRGLRILIPYPPAWESIIIPGLSSRRFKTFKEFAVHETPWGLGWSDKVLEAFCLPELHKEWSIIESQIGAANKNGIKNDKEGVTCPTLSNRGNSRTHSISVLKRDAPEIAQQVINKEISAAEGMRRAGKRKVTKTIPIDLNAIEKLLFDNFSQEVINTFAKSLIK